MGSVLSQSWMFITMFIMMSFSMKVSRLVISLGELHGGQGAGVRKKRGWVCIRNLGMGLAQYGTKGRQNEAQGDRAGRKQELSRG